MRIIANIEPMGTVRMTAGMVKRIKWNLYQPGDKKVERVLRYLQYKEKLSWLAKTTASALERQPSTGPIVANITFYMPMPDSWSQKKKLRMNGQPHTTKPDRDNLEKGVCDALNRIAWKDDGQVYDGRTRKFYSFEPRIEIEVQEVSA